MDYDLSRIDYAICGITFPDTLKILSGYGVNGQQKFAIGDKNGVLQCLSIKDEEPLVQFKTLPGKPITSVQLTTNPGAQGDKIFAASGNEVKGYTRKGKVFFSIETALSETITSMCVVGSDLILSSGRTVTHYRDLQEIHNYTCDDRVLDISAHTTPNNTRTRLLVLIANKGAAVLENGSVLSRIAVSSGPSRLVIPSVTNTSTITAFYGAADGSIGLFTFDTNLSSKCMVEGRGLGSVVCLGLYFSNGTHLAVGRHDGSIQLYLIDPENLEGKPRLKFTYFCGEPVTSVCGGCIGNEEPELLVATFSGRIFALRSHRLITGSTLLPNVPQDALASRRTKLESEVARLEKQVINEREKYQKSTRSITAGVSAPPLLDIHYELSGATHDGWQEAKLMSAVPLDMLFVYCNRKLEMQTDNAAVLSVCPSQDFASDFLATVRCQAGTRRLWLRMRYNLNLLTSPLRAESAKVLIYVLPAAAPRVSRLVSLRMPVLPHYSQHEDSTLDNENRSWSQVRMSGSFSVAEMTSWLSEALPGELPRPASSVVFVRSHTLLGTLLVCNYQRGVAVFKSDNVSTIAVIRDVLVNCSVEKRIRMEIEYENPDDCCLKSFERIKDKIRHEYFKYKNIALRKAIRDLDIDIDSNKDDTPLCQEYLDVLNLTDDSLETQFEDLVVIVVQWYVDWRSLSLISGDISIEKTKLQSALMDCRLEEVVEIFNKKLT